MPSYNTSGGLDFNKFADLVGQHYQNQIANRQRQQQLDYLYPQDLYVTPPLPQVVGGGPPINQLSEASHIGAQNRVNEAYAMPSRPVMDFRGNPVATPNMQPPIQYSPGGTPYQAPPTMAKPPRSAEEETSPDREIASEAHAPDNPYAKALNHFTDGTIAKRMGLKIDPETGGIHGPGRQVEEYNKMYLAILQGQAGILAAAERPMQTPGVQFLPQERPAARGGAKADDPLAKAQKSLKAIMDSNGVSGKFGGANKIRDPQARATAMDLEQKIRQLNGLDTQNNGGRVQVPVTSDPTDAALMADPRFKPAVDKYIKEHKVDKATAEKMILGILKNSKQVK